jgi:hypothetical protein
MKTRSLIRALPALAVALSIAGPASAVPLMVAGWDFSQYFSGGGFLSIDNQTLTNTLPANYSNLDASFGMGPDSAIYGTMYMNGEFGSTLVTPTGQGNEPFLPIPGTLSANADAPITPPSFLNPFDSLQILDDQGQLNENELRMAALGALSVVFLADLTSVQLSGTDWVLSFGARTVDANSTIGVQYSTDGVSYSATQNAIATPGQAPFSVDLAPGPASRMFVRFTFDNSGQASIDNVAVRADLIPEPATALLLAAGLVGLAAFRRRRA